MSRPPLANDSAQSVILAQARIHPERAAHEVSGLFSSCHRSGVTLRPLRDFRHPRADPKILIGGSFARITNHHQQRLDSRLRGNDGCGFYWTGSRGNDGCGKGRFTSCEREGHFSFDGYPKLTFRLVGTQSHSDHQFTLSQTTPSSTLVS